MTGQPFPPDLPNTAFSSLLSTARHSEDFFARASNRRLVAFTKIATVGSVVEKIGQDGWPAQDGKRDTQRCAQQS